MRPARRRSISDPVSRLPYNLPAQLYTGRGTSCRTGQQVSAGLRPSGAHSEPLVTMGGATAVSRMPTPRSELGWVRNRR